MANWTEQNIPDQTGRIIIVTGANSGLGQYTTQILAGKGAHVIMASRSLPKAEAARSAILAKVPTASLEIIPLDLADLDSVAQFAQTYKARHARVDVLYNNAGLMAIPRSETKQGFETQFGVNHLGHFALTGHLIERMANVPGSRIVTLSSTAAWIGSIHFDDINLTRNYSRYGAYGQAKLANLLFARELQRRLAAANAQTISLAAQPGFVLTELQTRAHTESNAGLEGFFYERMGPLLAQPLEVGTLPQLYAGTAPDVQPGGFYSPARFYVFGGPALIGGPRGGHDVDAARRLWEVSEAMTGVRYEALRAAQSAVA